MKRPQGEGTVLLCITIVMLALSWIVLISRLAVRTWIKALGLDDWLMAVGLVRASEASKMTPAELNSKQK
jgi:hypothetical protein